MKRHGVIVSPSGSLGATFNPAAVRLDDGRYLLLVRSVPKGYQKIGDVNQFDDNYTSHLSLWEAKGPADKFELVDAEALKPDQPFDKFGLEDPRITKIGDTFYIFYTALEKGLGQPDASDGIRIAMASTKDFKSFRKHGVIGPDRRSKAGAVFESGGKLWFLWKDEQAVERTMLSPAPANFEDPAEWKKFWAAHDIEKDQLVGPQKNSYEDHGVEPGAPPVAVPEGLLLVYSSISSDMKWTISLMLLDKDDPRKIISKTDAPSLKPEADYELKGDVNNVVFPCGALIDGGRLYVYYGGADTVCAVGSEDMAVVRSLLKPFKDNPAPRP
jgi:beta-1,2-mannobiose phosphorylase / 1,2-beta-oligomannan phosphorylase